jgi:HPt (histidine-containing phosphotransfer) domain-containing protein
MIKGTSAMLGALRLAECCAELEGLCRGGDLPDATTRVSAIEATYRTVEAALSTTVELPPCPPAGA